MHGRSIRLFLADGSANGIITAEIMNWTGKVLVFPRSQLAELTKREESTKTGIYVLVGEDPNSSLKDIIYIGESDSVISRLTSHNQDLSKDFWVRTVAVVSKDENLTKSHVRYLESRMIRIATLAGRATLSNGTAPNVPALPEADRADMEFFLEQLQILLPVLGFLFTTPVPSTTLKNNVASQDALAQDTAENSPLFTITGGEYAGEAQEVDGQFIVLKGSKARRQHTPSLSSPHIALREQLKKDDKLQEIADAKFLVFTGDTPFSSPSAAAAIITGTPINGREAWKVRSTGQTYNQWDQARINQASATQIDPE